MTTNEQRIQDKIDKLKKDLAQAQKELETEQAKPETEKYRDMLESQVRKMTTDIFETCLANFDYFGWVDTAETDELELAYQTLQDITTFLQNIPYERYQMYREDE